MTDHKPIGYSVKPPEKYGKTKKKKIKLIILYVAIFVLPSAAVMFLTLNPKLVAYTVLFSLAMISLVRHTAGLL